MRVKYFNGDDHPHPIRSLRQACLFMQNVIPEVRRLHTKPLMSALLFLFLVWPICSNLEWINYDHDQCHRDGCWRTNFHCSYADCGRISCRQLSFLLGPTQGGGMHVNQFSIPQLRCHGAYSSACTNLSPTTTPASTVLRRHCLHPSNKFTSNSVDSFSDTPVHTLGHNWTHLHFSPIPPPQRSIDAWSIDPVQSLGLLNDSLSFGAHGSGSIKYN